MIVYLDTSSLVKLYVDEIGSREIFELISRAQVVATSRVAYVEAIAAFVRKFALPKTLEIFSSTRKSFDSDWPNYFIIEVTEPITALAATLAEKHRLRGFDALHLASAVFIRDRLNQEIFFSAADIKLESPARKEGLS